jgi:hypothetical protein
MGRRNWPHYRTNLIGGINQDIDSARKEECADARNVWAPNGYVERRPGQRPVSNFMRSTLFHEDGALLVGIEDEFFVEGDFITGAKREDSAGTVTNISFGDRNFSIDTHTPTIGDNWYWPISSTVLHKIYGIVWIVEGSITANTGGVTKFEYYNGSAWAPLPMFRRMDPPHWGKPPSSSNADDVTEVDYEINQPLQKYPLKAAASNSTIFDADDNNASPRTINACLYTFTPPPDWSTISVGGAAAAYYIRWTNISSTLQYAGDPTVWVEMLLSDSVDYCMWQAAGSVQLFKKNELFFLGAGRNKWSKEEYAAEDPEGKYLRAQISQDVAGSSSYTRLDVNYENSETGLYPDKVSFRPNELGMVAPVSQFSEYFVAYDHNIYRIWDGMSRTDKELTKTDTRESITGSGAPFDLDTIPILDGFPRANYILFANNTLWAAGIIDEPYTIRWSAAPPYHRIWPQSAFEYLMEEDSSPITGLAQLGEHVVVFKRDSIWNMVFTDVDQFGVSRYTPVRTVSGVGCVSYSTIQKIRDELVFLAEDGIYAYNGSDVRKVTEKSGYDRLSDYQKYFTKDSNTVAVHWKEKRCYLLAVNNLTVDVVLGGRSTNNQVIVWDYLHDDLWIWDSMYVVRWIRRESASDREEIYFMNPNGSVYRLGGTNDNGAAITSYITTQRIGYESNVKTTLRQVEPTCKNDTKSLTVEVLSDDQGSGTSGTMTFDDVNEAKLGAFTLGTSTLAGNRIRARKMNFRKTGEYHQIKLTHNTKDVPFELRNLDVRYLPLGKR